MTPWCAPRDAGAFDDTSVWVGLSSFPAERHRRWDAYRTCHLNGVATQRGDRHSTVNITDRPLLWTDRRARRCQGYDRRLRADSRDVDGPVGPDG